MKIKNTKYLQDAREVYNKHLEKFMELKETIGDNENKTKALLSDYTSFQPEKKRELLEALKSERTKLLKEVNKNCDGYLRDIEDIKEKASSYFGKYYSISNSQINEDDYTMLERGLFKENELTALYDKYKDNRTMKRVIAKYTANSKDPDIVKLHDKCEHESRALNEINVAIDSTLPMTTRALGVGREGVDNVAIASGFQRRIDEVLSQIEQSLKPVTCSWERGSLSTDYNYTVEE